MNQLDDHFYSNEIDKIILSGEFQNLMNRYNRFSLQALSKQDHRVIKKLLKCKPNNRLNKKNDGTDLSIQKENYENSEIKKEDQTQHEDSNEKMK